MDQTLFDLYRTSRPGSTTLSPKQTALGQEPPEGELTLFLAVQSHSCPATPNSHSISAQDALNKVLAAGKYPDPEVAREKMVEMILRYFEELNGGLEANPKGIPLNLLKAIKLVIERSSGQEFTFTTLLPNDIDDCLKQLQHHRRTIPEINAVIDGYLGLNVSMPSVSEKAFLGETWPLLPADILSSIIDNSNWKSILVFAQTCRKLGQKIWYAMLNDHGKREAETWGSASILFHEYPALRQKRFRLLDNKCLSLTREQGISCGPKARQEILDGKVTIEETRERTSQIWLDLKKQYEKSETYKRNQTGTSQQHDFFRAHYGQLCSTMEKLTDPVQQLGKGGSPESLLLKYITDGDLSIEGCADSRVLYSINIWNGIVEVADYITVGAFAIGDFINFDYYFKDGSRESSSPFHRAVKIPTILKFLREGVFSPKELRDALLTNNRTFALTNAKLDEIPSVNSCFTDFFIKNMKYRSYYFNFADVLKCEFVQAGLMQGIKLAELVNLPDDVIYHLMFNGHLRKALKDGQLILRDIVDQNEKYIKHRKPWYSVW